MRTNNIWVQKLAINEDPDLPFRSAAAASELDTAEKLPEVDGGDLPNV